MRQLLLLRGINLGPHRRIAMPALRDVLRDAGFGDVRTYLQSGNVVLSSDAAPVELAAACERLLAERFGHQVDVLVRTRDELAAVVEHDPLGDVATNPRRYQVTFLREQPGAELVRALAALASPGERVAAAGRELYAWHPDGVARSRLWARLASPALGIVATSRNWTTVTNLLALADS